MVATAVGFHLMDAPPALIRVGAGTVRIRMAPGEVLAEDPTVDLMTTEGDPRLGFQIWIYRRGQTRLIIGPRLKSLYLLSIRVGKTGLARSVAVEVVLLAELFLGLTRSITGLLRKGLFSLVLLLDHPHLGPGFAIRVLSLIAGQEVEVVEVRLRESDPNWFWIPGKT
jgi:hypothetical protein